MIQERTSLDVSGLPDHGFGHRSAMWWGTLGMMIAEGTIFAGLFGMYGYLRVLALEWPMGAPAPGLLWGSVSMILAVLSCWPNHLCKKAAAKHDLQGVRIWLCVAVLFAVALTIVRFLEFKSLNCHWADNAYGSIIWVLLGFHTTHLFTDFLDTVVLAVLMFTGPITGKRFVDVSENAMYWYFVVLAWLPVYFAIYWLTRW